MKNKILNFVEKYELYIFIICNIILIICFLIFDLTYLNLGGILLSYASIWYARGNILFGAIIYLFADICWLLNAFEQDDLGGTVNIFIGIVSGIYIMYNMKQGIFRTSIKKDKNE